MVMWDAVDLTSAASDAPSEPVVPTEPAERVAPAAPSEQDEAPYVAAEPAPGETPSVAPPIDAEAAVDGIASGGIVPGAYLAPSTVHRPPPPPAVVRPALFEPPAGASSPAPDPAVPATSVADATAAPPAMPATQPGRVSFFADLPFDAPDSVTEWLMTIGSLGAVVSFLLPWIPDAVDYTSSWGLAGSGHLWALGLVILTAVLAVLPNPFPVWIRSGVLGLGAGSFLLGLLWFYIMSVGGAAFGAVIGAFAALLLIVAGVLVLAPRRPVPPAG